MADNFGLKIGIDGEKAFKQSLSEIKQTFKVLGSEMKLVASQFDKNETSIESLTARNQVLNKEIDTQKGERVYLFCPSGETPPPQAVPLPLKRGGCDTPYILLAGE